VTGELRLGEFFLGSGKPMSANTLPLLGVTGICNFRFLTMSS